MKKFFKALALVLALTLVVGTIPASAAEYEFSLKKEKKIIYLGGASGEKEVDGATVKCGTKSRYKISKLVKGFDPETMDIKLESSDPSIVKTSNAKDKVYAKSIGTADVKIFVYDKETDKQLKDLTVKVQVKKNATAPLAVVVTQEDGTPVDLTATKVGVGVPYIVTLPRKADGKFVDTDCRKIVADKESVKIEAANKYGTMYKVTFTEAGTFAITVGSYQSKLYPKLQNTITVPVTAGYEAEAAAQSSLDTAKVVFDTPVTKLDAANFKAVYTIDGVDDVEIPFADIAPDGITIDKEDNTVAYVKFLMPFAANTTYKIYYADKLAGTFKAVAVKADSVKQIIIPTQYITTDTETEIKYQLLDENGIDITAGVSAVGGSVSFDLVSDDANDYIVGSKIYVKTAHAVTVKGTYNYFDSESNYKSEPTGQGQVVAQAPEAFKLGKVEGIIAASDKLYVTGENKIDGNVKAIDWTMDGEALAYFQIAVPYAKSTGTLYEGFGNANLDGTYKDYTIEIADKTVALPQGLDADGKRYVIKANKAGSTSILVYGIKASDGSSVVIGVVPVVIKDARKLTSWTVTSSTDKINLAYGEVTYTVTAKDQEGQDFVLGYKVDVIDATDANNPITIINDQANDAGKATATLVIKNTDLTQANPDAAVTHNIKFVVNDDANSAKTLRLSAKNDGTTANRYLLKLTGTELKTGIKADTNNDASISLKLEGVTANNTAAPVASGVALKFTGTAVKAHAKGTTDDAGFFFTITKDGKLLENAPKQLSDVTFKAFESGKTASDAAVKLDKGTYVINAYEVYLNDAGTTYVFRNVGSAQTFTVTDDQAGIEFKKVAEAVDAFTLDNIVNAFEIKVGGAKVNGDANYTFAVEANYNSEGNDPSTATTAYIKAIKVTVVNGTTGSYTYTINPDTNLTKK